METSAKSATNVEDAFMAMAAEIKNRYEHWQQRQPTSLPFSFFLFSFLFLFSFSSIIIRIFMSVLTSLNIIMHTHDAFGLFLLSLFNFSWASMIISLSQAE